MQIKKERLEEKLRLARLSQRLHLQDEGRGRLSDLYKKILTALHRQRKVSVRCPSVGWIVLLKSSRSEGHVVEVALADYQGINQTNPVVVSALA